MWDVKMGLTLTLCPFFLFLRLAGGAEEQRVSLQAPGGHVPPLNGRCVSDCVCLFSLRWDDTIMKSKSEMKSGGKAGRLEIQTLVTVPSRLLIGAGKMIIAHQQHALLLQTDTFRLV